MWDIIGAAIYVGMVIVFVVVAWKISNLDD